MGTPNSNKTVRFADQSTSIRVFTAEEAPSPSWLVPSEFQDLRNKVKEDAEYLKTKGYGVLLKNCFDESDKLAQKHINAFVQLPGSECSRGVEVHLSRQHRDEIDMHHSKVTKGVLNRQQALREKGTPAEMVPDKLRSISRKHSRSSRVFARRLGRADQRAAQEGDDIWKAQAMVKELNQGNAKMVRRKASVFDMADLVLRKKGPEMFGLAYMAETNKVDRAPVRVVSSVADTNGRLASKCANVIQDALDLLDLGDDMVDDPFTTPNFQQGIAKTA